MFDGSTFDAFCTAISWRAAATNNFRWLARTAKGSGTSSYCLAANLYATLINGPASDGVTAGMRGMASLRMFWGTGFRSEERREGKECAHRGSFRGWP